MSSVSSIQKQRHVPVEGATNVRNLGGYPAAEGKTTKWGVIYRGDMLADVPPEAAQAIIIDQLHVHNTYDLRNTEEVAMKGYAFPSVTRHSYPMGSTHIGDHLASGKKIDREVMTDLFRQIYAHFLTTYPATFGALIKELIAQKPSADNAAYIHCTSGKDRTGLTCALILSLVGVDAKTVREDFLLTNQYYKQPSFAKDYMPGLMDDGASAVLWSVQPCFLDVFEDITKQEGGVRAFALKKMGLTEHDIAQLQALLLE